MQSIQSVDTHNLRPRLPAGFKMLKTSHQGYYAESIDGGFATEDFTTPVAACRAARRHRREQRRASR